MIERNLFIELAKSYSTPLYVYDFNEIKDRVLEFKNAFSARKSLLCYALKANSNLALLRHLSSLECGADCVSINEVKLALKAGIQPYKIIYSGVGKSDSDIREALESNILLLNIESIEEMLRVEKIASNLGKSARISIRVNPDIDAKTHPYISTGLKENKFGVDIESAKKMYVYAAKSRSLEPICVHFHIGSQLLDLEPIIEAAKKIIDLIFGLLALKIDIRFIDIGGGLGICYDNEDTIKLYDYAQGILGALSGLDLTIICEPGRRIVGNAGYLVASVLYEKCNAHKRFCIIDAAMNDLIRPSLYNAYHRIEHISLDSANEACEIPPLLQDSTHFHECADIVGTICESGDYLAKNVLLPRTKSGDLIIIHSAGAYGFSMASNYNARLKPAEVALIDDEIKLIRKRESLDDLLSTQIFDKGNA